MGVNKSKKPKPPGSVFESELADVCKGYAQAGLAIIRKCDPPSVTRFFNGRPVTILMSNPFLDFVGALNCGRMVMLEAKHTTDPRLNIGDSGRNIKDDQMRLIWEWDSFGVITGVLWKCANKGGVRMVWPEVIDAAIKEGRKSVRWVDAEPVVEMDFLRNIRDRMNGKQIEIQFDA